MTDRAFDAPSDDPFEQIAKGGDNDNGPAQTTDASDPFEQIAKSGGTPASSTTGAFVRGAVRGVAPAIGGLAAAAPSAEIGGAIGAAIGGPFAPLTGTVGAVLGGVYGFYKGSQYTDEAQNWLSPKPRIYGKRKSV